MLIRVLEAYLVGGPIAVASVLPALIVWLVIRARSRMGTLAD